jgi:DNA-binding beta-propeller fold protein YncE
MRQQLIEAVVAALAFTAAASAQPPRLELVQTIALDGKAGRLDHLALDTKHGRLFIANLSNDSLDVVDLKAGKLIRQISGQGKAQGVAYAADLDRVFVGCGTPGQCNVFDGASYRLLHSLNMPAADNVRYDPGAGLVHVVHAEHALTVFDGRTFAVKATVKLPGPPEALQLDVKRKRLYVNTHQPAQVAVVDLGTHEVIDRIPLTLAEANYPMALDLARQQVFIGCRKKPMVVALDPAARKELYAADIPGDVDDLFFDAQRDRLYAICGEGSVAVLERGAGGRFAVAEAVPTRKLARTGLFDPDGGRLFVVLPRLGAGEGPCVRIYRAKP